MVRALFQFQILKNSASPPLSSLCPMGNAKSGQKRAKGAAAGGAAAGTSSSSSSSSAAAAVKKPKRWGPYEETPGPTADAPSTWRCTVESDRLPPSFETVKDLKKFLRTFVNVDGRKGETVIFEPGMVGGLDLQILGCEDCSVIICDHTSNVTIDRCKGCRIIVGPCESSIFIRNSSNCKLVIACQQFRSADVKSCDLMLYSQTEPVIERVSKLRLCCYRLAYPALAGECEGGREIPQDRENLNQRRGEAR